MLPTFLVIGAMKAGTTSLYEYLRSHPQVFMSETKELKFFLDSEHEGNWELGLDWYEQQFAAAGRAHAVGEASVGYSMYPVATGVPHRIADVLPEVKLLYLVRHPIERMRSQYLMRVWNGRERMPIEEALLSRPFYVELSRYAMQVDQFLEYFPVDRMLVLRSEDLKKDRVGTMRRVFDFLDVHPDDAVVTDIGEFNAGERLRRHTTLGRGLRRFPGYSTMAAVMPRPVRRAKQGLMTRRVKADLEISDRTRLALEDQLRDDIPRLRAYLGEDFDGWGIA
jgi:hypothetical protein